VLSRHGVTADADEIERLISIVWKELDCTAVLGRDRFISHPQGARGFWARFLERMLEHLGAGELSPFAAAELYARFGRAEAWEIYPEALPALDQLAESGLKLGAIANWDERLPALLERLGLAGRFEAVVYSSEVDCEKPDPRIFRIALDRLSLPAEEVLHVGDRRREDLEGAVAVGMHALLLDRRRGQGDLTNLKALPAILGLSRAGE
jgi:putative hydrolase of the HAD superfamily